MLRLTPCKSMRFVPGSRRLTSSNSSCLLKGPRNSAPTIWPTSPLRSRNSKSATAEARPRRRSRRCSNIVTIGQYRLIRVVARRIAVEIPSEPPPDAPPVEQLHELNLEQAHEHQAFLDNRQLLRCFLHGEPSLATII